MLMNFQPIRLPFPMSKSSINRLKVMLSVPESRTPQAIRAAILFRVGLVVLILWLA
jgi:hypothetical protein